MSDDDLIEIKGSKKLNYLIKLKKHVYKKYYSDINKPADLFCYQLSLLSIVQCTIDDDYR